MQLLCIDPSPSRSASIQSLLPRGWRCNVYTSSRSLVGSLARARAGLLLVWHEVCGPELSRLVASAVHRHGSLPIIAYGAIDPHTNIVSAVRAGARDFLPWPFSVPELAQAIARCQPDQGGFSGDQSLGLVGTSRAMMEVRRQIRLFAPLEMPVLITGPSGSGKELVARAIHHHSRRSGADLVAVNCAALPSEVFESEMYGTRPGAFTGAVRRDGWVAAANGGTLFLDEIGDLAPRSQASALRMIETGDYVPLGSTSVARSDVRIVAATNRDLADERSFRGDLYWRLNALQIEIPGLDERREDLRDLAQHLLDTSDLPGCVLSEDAGLLLSQMDWPGNVRQLRNEVYRACVLSGGSVIRPEHLRNRSRRDSVS